MQLATPRTRVTPSQGSSLSSMQGTAFPNLPIQPKNGMIRTYDNQDRTFSRPYSAKTVFFYKEGDEYFTGVRVPISKSRYRTIDSLLDDLNENIQMPFGVRRLTTPMGRTQIEDITQLEHLGKYVASSSKYSRGINLSALERLKKARSQAEASLRRERAGGQSFWIPTSPSFRQKLRMTRTLGLDIVPSKQVFFILNGKGRFYRTLLNPLRLPSMEQLLVEVSNGLEVAVYRIYSSDGGRILNVKDILALNPPKLIACPRNEKPSMRDAVSLPAINPNRYAPRPYKTGAETSTTSHSNSSRENGIEKQHRLAATLRRNTRRMTGAPRRKMHRPLPAITPKKPSTSIPDETDSGRAVSISSGATAKSKIDEDGNSSDYPENEEMAAENKASARETDSVLEEDDQTDKLSTSSKKAEMIRQESAMGSPEPDEPDRVKSEESRPVTAVRNGEEEEQMEDEKEPVVNGHSEEHAEEVPSRMTTGVSQREDILESGDEQEPQTGDQEEAPATASSQREEVLPEDEPTDHDVPPDTACSQKENELPDDKTETPAPPETASSQKEKNLPDENDEGGDTLAPPDTACSQKEDNLPEEKEEENVVPTTANSQKEEILPDHESDEKEVQAATVIQAAFRGFTTRKKLKVSFDAPPTAEKPGNGEATLDETTENETDSRSERHMLTPPPEPKYTYTISVMTGNRWGADTEADLYIQLQGDNGKGSKIDLKQESPEPRFRQNQLDSFYDDGPLLGTLNKITIGHDKKGYGAGVFIEYVLVTENTNDGRQFIFFLNKWLDSGQVDGKLERSVPVSAFYYMDSIPEEDLVTQGRWEFVLHSGTQDGLGGTTSNIQIYGYGTDGSSVTTVENDNSLQTVPSTTLVQVDFGAIGDLIKVRFEIDGIGDRPDYYLEYVELRDLDTDERLAVRIGKWLDVTGEHKRPQSFREIPVFRAGVQPLTVINYEGRVQLADTRLLRNTTLYGELHGEFDSGVFPMTFNETKKEFNFKVECVHLGRINKMKIIGNFSERGQAVLEGMSVLQDIWDCYAPGVSVADQILSPLAYVRESTHCPYRYVLSHGKIVGLSEDKPYFKTLCLTGMEGLTTKFKKAEVPSGTSVWKLDMSIEAAQRLVPEVHLCKGKTSHQMSVVHNEEDEISYQLKSKSLSTVDKVRVSVGELNGSDQFTVKKMRLSNALTAAEIRYPNVHTDFDPFQTYEYSTVYPDVPPKMNLLYNISLRTVTSSGSFQPRLNLLGSESNSGPRSLGPPRELPAGVENFDIEAVNIGNPKDVEISIHGEKGCSWNFEVTISQNDTELDLEAKGSITNPGENLLLPLVEL